MRSKDLLSSGYSRKRSVHLVVPVLLRPPCKIAATEVVYVFGEAFVRQRHENFCVEKIESGRCKVKVNVIVQIFNLNIK